MCALRVRHPKILERAQEMAGCARRAKALPSSASERLLAIVHDPVRCLVLGVQDQQRPGIVQGFLEFLHGLVGSRALQQRLLVVRVCVQQYGGTAPARAPVLQLLRTRSVPSCQLEKEVPVAVGDLAEVAITVEDLQSPGVALPGQVVLTLCEEVVPLLRRCLGVARRRAGAFQLLGKGSESRAVDLVHFQCFPHRFRCLFPEALPLLCGGQKLPSLGALRVLVHSFGGQLCSPTVVVLVQGTLCIR
mmetsp:Transcript_28825/g.73124  ORF Transcript_28825/g.73124 Transcript_28825/m.73124 type:complete len:247 (+) Transcript_28825:27-767(+)